MQMLITRDELKALIDEIIETKFQADAFYEDDPVRAVPRLPAASDRDLAALESHLRKRRLRFPPSYRLFLSIYNGIKFLFEDEELTLLTAREVINGEHTVSEDDFPTLSRFVIASGDTSEFISFDPEKVTEHGEMEVVRVTIDGEEVRGSDWVKFLRNYLDYQQNVLKVNRADRERLAND